MTAVDGKVDLDATASDRRIHEVVSAWVVDHVPATWRSAAAEGRERLRSVRSRAAYEEWYPTFAASGLVVASWSRRHGGLDLSPAQARVAESVLMPLNLGRLNPLGLNCAAPALFAYGTEEQQDRYLEPLVRNEEVWCQLLSEPGAGSDLASLATRAQQDGDCWVVTGQKVWTTWAHRADLAVCLVRTDPGVPKRRGLTYLIIDLHAPGVTVRPLRHLGGEVDFNEVYLDEVVVPDHDRIGPVGEGWRVAAATLAGERQMVSGASSGGVDRIGGGRATRLPEVASAHGRAGDATARQAVAALIGEEKVRGWTNERARAGLQAGQGPGPAASVGKVHQGALNQRVQTLAVDLCGAAGQAWEGDGEGSAGGPDPWAGSLPYEVRGMLRSRANTIEGGTTEVNKNILGEKVLGLPREPDPWRDRPWSEVPRS